MPVRVRPRAPRWRSRSPIHGIVASLVMTAKCWQPKGGAMRFVSLLSVVIFLSGCIGTGPLNYDQRKKISVVKINRNIQKNSQMYYMGPGSGALLMGGAVGGAVAGAVSAATKKPLQDYAEK